MTPIFKKLNFKECQQQVVVINAPLSFESELNSMKAITQIETYIEKVKSIEFVICFIKSQKEIDDFIQAADKKMPGDTVLWLCYPKAKSKKYKSEINRDFGWAILGKYGLEGVRQVSIDEDWSALRFRRVEFIKKITRRESYALTKDAKRRTTQKGK
jgi:hypothetical protein